jgi:hypothetical protein
MCHAHICVRSLDGIIDSAFERGKTACMLYYCSSFVASAFHCNHGSHALKTFSLGNINNAAYHQHFASDANNFMESQSCADFRNLKAIGIVPILSNFSP